MIQREPERRMHLVRLPCDHPAVLQLDEPSVEVSVRARCGHEEPARTTTHVVAASKPRLRLRHTLRTDHRIAQARLEIVQVSTNNYLQQRYFAR